VEEEFQGVALLVFREGGVVYARCLGLIDGLV